MPDEKRIKDFEPATDLLIDDWFAVDSPSQGTRKMQASMFQEGLQTQITTNTENIALHSGQITVLQQGVGNIGDKVDVLDAAITVEEYSATKLYAVDDDCVYEGVRYKCTTAIETPETFTPSHWQAISIEGELNELNSSLEGVISSDLRNNIGVKVNLDAYTSTNYICPSDGYVRCDCSAGTTAKSVVDISGATTGSLRMGGWANGTYGMYVCYVKKGMIVRVVTLDNGGHVWFYSLV